MQQQESQRKIAMGHKIKILNVFLAEPLLE